MKKLFSDYQAAKMDFLDALEPDDFRNGESFNQTENIIDRLNEAFYQAFIDQKNPEEFINKAVSHLFREKSSAIQKATDLARIYLEMKLGKAA